jgi:hypothetical protein
MKRTEEVVFGDGVDWVKDQFLGMTRRSRASCKPARCRNMCLVSGLIASALAFMIIFLINFGWSEQIINWLQQTFLILGISHGFYSR